MGTFRFVYRLCLKGNNVFHGVLRFDQIVTVVNVDTSGDLRWCKVYLSVMGDVNEKEFKKGLKSASGWLRRELGQSLKLRNTPELTFELDHSIEYGAHISEILSGLDIPKDEDGE